MSKMAGASPWANLFEGKVRMKEIDGFLEKVRRWADTQRDMLWRHRAVKGKKV